MKKVEKDTAVLLRKKGVSMRDIAKQLGVAKSTVSYWVRDVVLSTDDLRKLRAKSHSRTAIEKRRTSRMQRHEKERQKIFDTAFSEAPLHLKNPLWCVAVSLYWGEGGKTQRTLRIANSDPAVIALMSKFFRDYCNVPLSAMRGHIHAFPDTDVQKAIRHWSEVSGIPAKQFFKTYIKNSVATKNKKHTLPYGTCQIYVHDSRLFITMMGWMSYLKQLENYD